MLAHQEQDDNGNVIQRGDAQYPVARVAPQVNGSGAGVIPSHEGPEQQVATEREEQSQKQSAAEQYAMQESGIDDSSVAVGRSVAVREQHAQRGDRPQALDARHPRLTGLHDSRHHQRSSNSEYRSS